MHVLAGHLVKGPERLVHQQETRLEGQGPGDRHPLLHATRELPGVVAAELLKAHQLQHGRRPGRPVGLGPVVQLQGQLDVGGHTPPVEQAGVLEDHAIVLVETGLVSRFCEHGDRAGRRLQKIADEPEQGRLAATGGSDQRHELAWDNSQVNSR